MKRISLSELKEGDQIAEPVINNFGQTLIPSKTKITVRYINLLKMWGIENVFIKESDNFNSEDDMVVSDETKQHIQMQLSKRFKWQPDNEWESAIFQLAYSKMVKSLTGKK